jgi:imidazolonepropionase-like amidohydrolase
VPTYVADVTLFDGRTVEPGRGVLFDGDRIRWVGPHVTAPPEAVEADQVDGRGRTLTPGLIDAHVHLAWDGTNDMAEETKGLTDDVARAKAIRNLERHLAAGVTTVRDLGAPSAVICEIATEAAGPRVATACSRQRPRERRRCGTRFANRSPPGPA